MPGFKLTGVRGIIYTGKQNMINAAAFGAAVFVLKKCHFPVIFLAFFIDKYRKNCYNIIEYVYIIYKKYTKKES